jgi:hypothetical protein
MVGAIPPSWFISRAGKKKGQEKKKLPLLCGWPVDELIPL